MFFSGQTELRRTRGIFRAIRFHQRLVRESTLTKPRIARFPDTEILLSICSGIEKLSKNQKISSFCAGLAPRGKKVSKITIAAVPCDGRRGGGRMNGATP